MTITAKVSAALVFAAMSVVLPTGTSHADIAPCKRDVRCGYEGLNPETTGCASGAYPVNNWHVLVDTGPTGNLHLMYSPHCNTNWVEADGLLYTGDIVAWNTAGADRSKQGVASGGGYGFTAMINGAYDAGGCLANYRFFRCIGQDQITTFPPYGTY